MIKAGVSVYNREEILNKFLSPKKQSFSSKYRNIESLINSGKITRTGRNSYSLIENTKKVYDWSYSEWALSLAKVLSEKYIDLNFSIFETRQLNEFMNQQLGSNTLFLYIEHEQLDFVFKDLNELYPGKILLKPTPDIMWTYLQKDTIIANRLTTESPKGRQEKWTSLPEKFLVDIVADKNLNALIPKSQFQMIYDGFLSGYSLDMGKMLRYARRRSAKEELEKYLKQE